MHTSLPHNAPDVALGTPTQNRDANRVRVARAISHLLRIGYDALSPEEAARMAAEGDKLAAPRKTKEAAVASPLRDTTAA